jgi:hypothetical protein
LDEEPPLEEDEGGGADEYPAPAPNVDGPRGTDGGALIDDTGSDTGGEGAARGTIGGSLGELVVVGGGAALGPGGGGAATVFYNMINMINFHHFSQRIHYRKHERKGHRSVQIIQNESM